MIVQKYLPLSGSVAYYDSENPVPPKELEEMDLLMMQVCRLPYKEEEIDE